MAGSQMEETVFGEERQSTEAKRNMQFAPKFNITERIIPVFYKEQCDIEVEVPEKTFHKIIKHVPQYQEKDVETLLEVHEIHHHTELDIREEWNHEEAEAVVPRTIVGEVLRPVHRTEMRDEEELIEVAVNLPTIERVRETPNVLVQEKLNYVTLQHPAQITEETIEVEHTVEVPHVVPVPKIEHMHSVKEVIVPHVHLQALVVEVPHEEVVDRVVEVPQTYTTKNIRYVPTFSQPSSSTKQSRDVAKELQAACKLIEQLEREKKEMRSKLTETLENISDVRGRVDHTQRQNACIEEQINIALLISGEVDNSDLRASVRMNQFLHGAITAPVAEKSKHATLSPFAQSDRLGDLSEASTWSGHSDFDTMSLASSLF